MKQVLVAQSGPTLFFATLWNVARQAPLSMGFSRQEYRGKGEQETGWGEEGEDRRHLGEIFKLKELPRAVLLSDWFQAIAALALP